MRNFLLGFLIFLVWSFFALWLYSWLDPVSSEEQATNEVPSVESGIEANEINDELNKAVEQTEIDTLNIDEAYKTEFIEESVNGLKAVSEAGDIIFLYPEGFTISSS